MLTSQCFSSPHRIIYSEGPTDLLGNSGWSAPFPVEGTACQAGWQASGLVIKVGGLSSEWRRRAFWWMAWYLYATWVPRFVFPILQSEPCCFYLFIMYAASISKENWRHDKMEAGQSWGVLWNRTFAATIQILAGWRCFSPTGSSCW